MNSKISDKDKKDWDNFLSNDEILPNKDFNSKTNKIQKIKIFDLHGYSLDEANLKVNDFIYDSFNNKASKIIIVTGKGLHSQNEKDPYVSKDLSILKYSVPDFIENNPDIMKKVIEIKDAEVKDGGSGAFYIFLKKKK